MPDHAPMILLASADARGELLDMHAEVSRLDSLFQSLRHRGVHYRLLPYAGLEAITNALNAHRHQIAIVHYAGHADEGRLMLEAALGSAGGAAHAEGLAGLLGGQRGLKLVFLNGCSTLPQVDLLLGAGVPAVIATSRAINDAVARDFAITFYEALTVGRQAKAIRKGQSIAEAFASAENFVKEKYSASPGALYRELLAEAQDVREVTKGLPWLLRPGAGAPALRWRLFEYDPLFGLPKLPKDLPKPHAPVRRLEWFRRDDARIFFGRSRAIRALYDAVAGRSGAPMVLYYGATGAGKSSVLHAGLMPRLEADHDVRYLRREPSRGLADTLRQALTAGPDAALPEVWRAREQASGKPLVIILDQVEEAFTRPLQPTGAADELAALAQAVGRLGLPAERPRGKLILGFRKEWLQEVEQALAAVAVTEDMIAKVPLDPMNGQDIREAVSRPAHDPDLRHIRLQVDHDLPALIAHDLLSDEDARAVIAPTLQVILSQLWDQVKDHSPRRYSVDLYHTLRTEGLLLRDFLRKQLKALKSTHPTEVENGFDLEILEAHTTSWGTANRRSRLALAEQFRDQATRLPGLLQRFKDLYLLVEPPPDPKAIKDPRVQLNPETSLAHDALAPQVHKRYTESSAPGQLARKLLDFVGAKSTGERGPATFSEAQLALVDAGIPWTRRPDDHERQVIDNSRVALERQKAREQSLARWRDRLGIAAGIGLLIASILAWGFWDERDAAVEAGKNLGEQIEATRKAIEGLNEQVVIAGNEKKRAECEARLALIRLQHTVLTEVGSIWRTDPVRAQVLLDDTEVFPSTDRDFAWGYHRGLCDWVRTIDAGERFAVCLAYSVDGRTLAMGGRGGKLRLWDAATWQQRGPPIDAHAGAVFCLAYSIDGRALATGGFDVELRQWDAATLQPRGPPIDVRMTGVWCLAYSIDGRTLATGGGDGKLWQRDAATRQPHGQPIDAHQFGVRCLAYSVDGRALATGGGDGKLRLWDAATRQPRSPPIDAHQAGVRCLAYSIDGRTLATGGHDGKLRLWDAATCQPRGPPIDAHQNGVVCLAFRGDSRMLVTGGGDGTLRFWKAMSAMRESSESGPGQ
jgi:hypothetical protein